MKPEDDSEIYCDDEGALCGKYGLPIPCDLCGRLVTLEQCEAGEAGLIGTLDADDNPTTKAIHKDCSKIVDLNEMKW
jgi:hypothetical protein